MIKGLGIRDGQVVVFKGACLSSKVERVVDNWVIYDVRVVAGAEYNTELRMSEEKAVGSTARRARVSLVVRGGRLFKEGTVIVDRIARWSEKGTIVESGSDKKVAD